MSGPLIATNMNAGRNTPAVATTAFKYHSNEPGRTRTFRCSTTVRAAISTTRDTPEPLVTRSGPAEPKERIKR